MKNNNSVTYTLLKGTFILTITGIITRILGFVYRVYLTNSIGAIGIGLIQVVTPIAAIVLSGCAFGIQTAICKYTASSKNGLKMLCAGLLISIPLSIFASIFVYSFSEFIATNILLIPQTKPLVEIISLSFPFASFHTCVLGFYLGKRKSSIPAVSQLIEQIVRISFIVIYAQYYIRSGIDFPIKTALLGNIYGDIAASFFCIITISFFSIFSIKDSSNYKKNKNLNSDESLYNCVKKIFFYSLPLTLNRVLLQLLQSAETILVPAQLVLHGLTNSYSIEIYGIITGMAMPLILFPTALTNSLSAMLLPVISNINSNSNSSIITKTLDKTIYLCCMLGIISTFTYIFFIGEAGSIIFDEPLVKPVVQTLAWLCPFIYLSSILSSVIKGIGMTSFFSSHSIISVLLKLAVLIFLVPRYGITAYMSGILLAFVYTTIVFYIKISRMFNYRIKTYDCIIKPILTSAFSIITGLMVKNILFDFTSLHTLYSLLAGTAATGITYLLTNLTPLKRTLRSG